LLATERDRLRLDIDFFTVHVTLIDHLYKLGFAEQKDCRLCGEEDSLHILCPDPEAVCFELPRI